LRIGASLVGEGILPRFRSAEIARAGHMHAKIRAHCEGLGVGWLPRDRAAGLLKQGRLVEKRMADPREPNQLFVAWRGDQQGRALEWWLAQLRNKRLATRLVRGVEVSLA
jgi:DNA-binding transcriptional LysR family regulator